MKGLKEEEKEEPIEKINPKQLKTKQSQNLGQPPTAPKPQAAGSKL